MKGNRFNNRGNLIRIIAVLLSVMLFAGACSKEKEPVDNTGTSASTGDSENPSFRKRMGEDKDVVYIGLPRRLNSEGLTGDTWVSSDPETAIVTDGLVTGKKEGVVSISLKSGNETVKEWEFLVTTFNDGKQAELNYELGREKIREMLAKDERASDPEFWKQNINTFQDAIAFFQERKFEYTDDILECFDSNIEWIWTVSGAEIVKGNKGYTSVMADALIYLLGDDFEDCGYFLFYGKMSGIRCYFYEDGVYYYLDIKTMINDFKSTWYEESYVPFKTESLEELENYVKAKFGFEDVLDVVIMVSAKNGGFHPPLYLTFIQDSSRVMHEHSVIGMEDVVLEKAKIIYENKDLDFELKAFSASEMPEEVPKLSDHSEPKYSANSYYAYE